MNNTSLEQVVNKGSGTASKKLQSGQVPMMWTRQKFLVLVKVLVLNKSSCGVKAHFESTSRGLLGMSVNEGYFIQLHSIKECFISSSEVTFLKQNCSPNNQGVFCLDNAPFPPCLLTHVTSPQAGVFANQPGIWPIRWIIVTVSLK